MESIGDSVSTADEVHGFRYFDGRDVMGFVDGTENPRGDAAREAAIAGDGCLPHDCTIHSWTF